jgi:hypothetical protein
MYICYGLLHLYAFRTSGRMRVLSILYNIMDIQCILTCTLPYFSVCCLHMNFLCTRLLVNDIGCAEDHWILSQMRSMKNYCDREKIDLRILRDSHIFSTSEDENLISEMPSVYLSVCIYMYICAPRYI